MPDLQFQLACSTSIHCEASPIEEADEFWLLVNRYYDPATEEWLSVDPEVAGTNEPYVFAGGDPINAYDPLGLCIKFFGAVCSAYDKTAGAVKHGAKSVQKVVKKAVKVVKKAAVATGTFVAKHERGELQIVGALAAVTAIVATGGAAALGEGALATALDTTATVASFTAAASDAPGCFGDHEVASCVGVAAGGLTGGLGAVARFGTFTPPGIDALTQFKVVGAGTLGLLGFLGDQANAAKGT